MIQLDVLRGVAIIMVLLRHTVVPWSKAGVLQYPMLFLWKIGWTGVDLFFVLSGFLIGGLLFKEILKTDRLDVKRFFIRRGLKIWPPYFVLLALLFIELRFSGNSIRDSLVTLMPNLVHLQNYFDALTYHGQSWSLRGHTWSLAVEEHFYLALPIFLILLTRGWRNVKALSAIPIAAIVIIVACTATRCITNWHGPFVLGTYQYPTHLRIDGLFFGVLLAYLYHMKPAMLGRIGHHKWPLLLVGLALVLPMGFFEIGEHRWVWTIGFTSLYVGYGCILLACVYTAPGDGPLGKIIFSLPARGLAWIGLFSYSIYLWQADLGSIPVRRWIMPHLPKHPTSVYWAMSTSIYLAVTIITGIVMSKLIEMPVLALRDRFFPPRIPIPTRPAPHDSATVAIAVAMDQSTPQAPAVTENV
jgi:peptidoglycan/LPS O-acetylase OafA/YrhL